jgi:integrase
MQKKELKKAYEEGIIDEEKFKQELFKLETQEKKIKKAKRIQEPITYNEFSKLIQKTRKEKHKLAFRLAYGSGLRISEIVGGIREDGSKIPPLTPENIDLKGKKIIVRGAKGKKDRIVNSPPGLKEKHLQMLPLEMTARNLQATFLRNSLKAKINRIIDYIERGGKQIPRYRLHFHSLRRSYATILLERGVPVHHVQALMGHESLATTTRYTKAKQQDAIDSAKNAWGG